MGLRAHKLANEGVGNRGLPDFRENIRAVAVVGIGRPEREANVKGGMWIRSPQLRPQVCPTSIQCASQSQLGVLCVVHHMTAQTQLGCRQLDPVIEMLQYFLRRGLTHILKAS
jgi:hypothetical protein